MSQISPLGCRARFVALAPRALWLKLGIGVVVSALAGCAAKADIANDDETPNGPAVTSGQAIVHGAADGNRHPAVVALIASDSSGTALCTGSLIAPDVVLTARHCVSRLKSESVECPSKTAQVGSNRPASSIVVVLGDDINTGTVAAKGKTILTPDSDVLCDHDIALIRLDRAIPGITPLTFAPKGTPRVAGHIQAVGFGQLGDDASAGVRHFRTHVPIVSVEAAEFMVGESTCSGDSGGPAIDEDSGGIVGVVSRGGPQCDGKGVDNIYTRVDPFFALIEEALGHALATGGKSSGSGDASPSSGMGDGCKTGATCAGGVCVQDQYCSRHCGGDAGRCPNGFRCAPDASGTGAVCAKKS